LRRGRGFGRGKEPPRHLDLRARRFLVGDQPGRTVAFDFLELIAVDRDIAPRPQAAGPARQRPEHGQNGHGRHQRESQPQRHALKSIRSNSTFRWRRGRRTYLFVDRGRPARLQHGW
jgi:hypothetical protein